MRRLATALSAAIVLVGSGAAFAAPAEKPDRPAKVKQCNDGLDNDSDGLFDLEDTGCGSPNDNSEADEPASGGGGGGGTPALPDPAAVVDEVLGGLPDGPPEPGGVPDLAAVVDEVLGGLPDGPPAPEPPAVPDPVALVEEVVAGLPDAPPLPA